MKSFQRAGSESAKRSEGTDMLEAAAKLGKILHDPLRISPHISLKKAGFFSTSDL